MQHHARDIIDLYQRRARDWDDARGGTLCEQAWLDRFVSRLPPRASVLDLGCGSGRPIASYILQRGFEIVGIDAAPAMIGLCRTRHPLATFHVADMRTLSLARQFDGIVAWDSLFHLTREDQRAMFPVIAAHARAGAALLFTSGPADGEVVGSFQGEPLYHASLDAEAYRAGLQAHGFAVMAHAVEDPECGGHTVWLAQRPRATGAD